MLEFITRLLEIVRANIYLAVIVAAIIVAIPFFIRYQQVSEQTTQATQKRSMEIAHTRLSVIAFLGVIIVLIIILLTASPVPASPVPASPVPASATKFHVVSLQNVGTSISENLGLPAGQNTLRGVDFETNWIVTTQSAGGLDENKPTAYNIEIKDTIQNPIKVYFLLHASWAKGLHGQEIGNLFIRFRDGQEVEEKLTVGYNIRDWADTGIKLTSPNTQEAFRSADGAGVVDLLAINIPEEYQQSQITQIEVRDTSKKMGLHIWAITVEQLEK